MSTTTDTRTEIAFVLLATSSVSVIPRTAPAVAVTVADAGHVLTAPNQTFITRWRKVDAMQTNP